MTHLDFKKVTKFTDSGKTIQVVPLKELHYTINRFQEKYNLELNPDFQRGHVWTEKQQIAFVEYVLKGGFLQPIRLNHNDWMNFKDPNPVMVCVDGLQRVTALLKFMSDELPIFGGYYFKDIDNVDWWKYDIPIAINALKTRKEVLNWYIELNTGGTLHTDEEIDRVKNLLESESGN